jgi:small subunit ribosomal protein S17
MAAKTIVGTVSSDKADKTITVTVVTRKTHPLYKKQYSVGKKFMAHDEKNEAKIGDKVSIAETRPLSARKRYVLKKILERPAIRESEVVKDAAAPEAEPATTAAKAEKQEEKA